MNKETLNNWFELDYEPGEREFAQSPKMTQTEFIEKAKALLRAINDGHAAHYKDRFDEDDESEENMCQRCGGFTQIEQGGNIVDCTSCNGTGLNTERVFDKDGFCEFMEHTIIFGEYPFFELLECDVTLDIEPIKTDNK